MRVNAQVLSDASAPSRRGLIAGIGAAALAVAPAMAAGASIGEPAVGAADLAKLIDAHRAAHAVHLASIEASDAAREAARADRELLKIETRRGRKFIEADKVPRAQIESEIREQYRWARRQTRESHFTLKDDRVLAEQLAAIDVAESDDLASVARSYATFEARPLRRAVAEADARWRKATEADDAALLAVCAHRCRTLDDVRRKARYLQEEWNDEEPLHSHVVALLAALAGNEAEPTHSS